MQPPARSDVAALLDHLTVEAMPNHNAREAWQALIRAHATLMRQLATDLVDDIGLTLAAQDTIAEYEHERERPGPVTTAI